MEEKETKKEEITRGTVENPKVIYKYVVVAKDVGLNKPMYDFEGLPLKEDDPDKTPSIDREHIALDIIDLGERLDTQLKSEQITRTVLGYVEDYFKSLTGEKKDTPEK